jgi:hypothetical protein
METFEPEQNQENNKEELLGGIEKGAPTAETMQNREENIIMKITMTVPAGEHLTVGTLMKSEIIVSPGSKLTITNVAMKNKITVKNGGVLEIKGQNMKNEIVNE